MTPHTHKILIIDDDERIVRATATRLRSAGYHCLTALNAEEGLALCASSEVVLVITDLVMPGVGGIGLIHLLRNHNTIPIIAITGHSDELRSQIEQHERVTILKKPYDSDALLNHVKLELAASQAEVTQTPGC